MPEGIKTTNPQPPGQPETRNLEELRQKILQRQDFVIRVCSGVLNRAHRMDIVDDMVNRTLFKALKSAAQYQEERGGLDSWLTTIAANTIRDYFRSRESTEKEKTINIDKNFYRTKDQNPNIEEQIIAREENDARMKSFREAFNRLPARHQEILQMDFDELTMLEIAQRLSIPENTVKSRLFRAKRKLAELMGQNPKNLKIPH